MNKKIAVLFFFTSGFSLLLISGGWFLWQANSNDSNVHYYEDRVIYEKNYQTGEGLEGYSVDHTSFLYAIDGKGRLREIYSANISSSMIVEMIQQIM